MRQSKNRIKPLLDGLGWLVITVAILFLAKKCWISRFWFAEWRPDAGLLISMAAATLLYAVFMATQAFAWAKLAQYWQPNAATVFLFRLCARTQIAKYIPGNVFHIAGRWMGARQLGLSHAAIIAATVYELGGLAIVAAFIALPGLPVATSLDLPFNLLVLYLGIAILAAISPFFAIKVTGLLARWQFLKAWPLQTKIAFKRGYVPAHFLFIVFFVATALLFAIWAKAVCPQLSLSQTPLLVSIFAFAWLAGFIMPGASGGIGVREAILSAALEHSAGSAEALIIAFGFRIITIAGDVLLFIGSFLLPKPVPNLSTDNQMNTARG